MNKPVVYGSVAVVLISLLYYRHRSNQIQELQEANPNASSDAGLGSIMANSTYQGNTGAVAETYTANDRYSEYMSYLNQGGTASGSSFNQFLTASQGQSLPLST